MSTRFSKINGMATKIGKPYTLGSINFIKRNASKLTLKAIAAILHRTTHSVRSIARRNNINF